MCTERSVVPVTAAGPSPGPDAVACAGLCVGYGPVGHGGPPALAGLDLAVPPGETVALLGESGSGKTTLLNAIAGFVPPLAGEIWLAGELASGPGRSLPPERRRIGMVFQDHALWPHLSVLDTVAYPLRRAGASRAAVVYAEPGDLTVARLTGPVSVLDAPVRAAAPGTCTIEVGEARVTVPAGSAPAAGAAAPVILVRPDWARLGGDLPGLVEEVRFRGPHTDYHVGTPAGPLLIREPGPPRAASGPVRWSLLRARLMPRDHPAGPKAGTRGPSALPPLFASGRQCRMLAGSLAGRSGLRS
jgi:hypothetical protein